MSKNHSEFSLSAIPWRSLAVVLVASLAAIWWFSRPPIKLNDDQYAITLALYRICNQRSEIGLDQIEALLEKTASQSGETDRSVDAIKAIIYQARESRWPQATRDCRLLLDKQVQR